MDTMMTVPLLNQRECAAYLGVSERTLEGWRLRGGGPAYIRVGQGRRRHLVRYRPADVEQWIADRSVANAAQIVA